MIRYHHAWVEECPSCHVDFQLQTLPGQRIIAQVENELGMIVKIILRWCACPQEQLIQSIGSSRG